MRKDVLAKALAFLLILSSEAHSQMQNQPTPDPKIPTIQVTGTGSVQVKPDTASISIGVSTEDGNAQNAVSRNNAATAKVISELEAAAIEKKDLKTSNFSVYPQYRTEGSDKHPVVTYRASNTVTVTVHNLDKVGDILTKAVTAGSNQISGPNFSVSDAEKYLAEARKKAVENAIAKASVYANAAGLKLGSILSMVEEGAAAPVYAPRSASFSAAAAPVPVEAGEENIQARILLVVELKS
ncbi:MAG: SIMPL domain-containing protein [Rhodomicrobium sp.]